MKKGAKSKKMSKSAKVAPKTVFGLTPLSDRVIVKEIKEASTQKTDSGIYLPANTKEDRGAKRGRVVAVGKGRTEDGDLMPMTVKSGDEVLFSWGDTIIYNGEEYIVVRESEISAIIN